MKKKLSIVLIIALLFGVVPPLGARAAVAGIVRVGLAYKDNTIATVSLRNKVGSGYSLGYYDDQRQLVPLAWTDQSKISVLITQNLYLTSAGGYSFTAGSRGAVGCYHIQLPGSYEDFASAKAAADGVENGFVAWIEGTYCVRAGSFTKRSAAEEAAAATGIEGACMGETGGYGYSVVETGTTRILFQFDANVAGESGAIGVQPIAAEGEKAVTVYNEGQSYYGGFRFERINGGSSTVANMIEVEDYIKGVIPYEMSPSWPQEALKAQAVCARTYAGNTRHGTYHLDMCTSTDCQAYKGTSGAKANTDQAVDETAGLMLHYNGRLISDAVYYSSNGGASEDVKNVWGSDYGYLKGKVDPYEEFATASMTKSQLSYYRWSKTLSGSELKSKLQKSDRTGAGDVVSVTLKMTPLNNVSGATFTDVNGKSWTVSPGDKVRTLLGVNSNRYTVSTSGGGVQITGYAVAGGSGVASLSGLYAINGDGQIAALGEDSYVITDTGIQKPEPVAATSQDGGVPTFTFSGTGWGHNVGMSQWGAYAMAKQGFDYREILTFYYTGITIE